MAAASTSARRGVSVARVVVFGLSRLWPGDWRDGGTLVGEHANLPDRLGVLGDGGARTERGREIDGRATKCERV